MNDGNRVSVSLKELMSLVSEDNGKFVAVSKKDLDDRPGLERTKGERRLTILFSSDEDDSSDEEHSDDEEDDDRNPSAEVPNLQDLRAIMKAKSADAEDDEHGAKPLEENPWAKRALMGITEDENDSTRNMAQQPALESLSLRGLLGERLKKTNPKKWEESSMVSSTLACMTNLIDPGDVMKIRNFASRPRLNGATVFIVGRTEGSSESNRWDVRIIQRKDPGPNDAVTDSNRILSVAAENLKHFV